MFRDVNDVFFFKSYDGRRRECNSGTGVPPFYVNVNMWSGEPVNNWMDSLQAAWPGVQVCIVMTCWWPGVQVCIVMIHWWLGVQVCIVMIHWRPGVHTCVYCDDLLVAWCTGVYCDDSLVARCIDSD